MTDTDNTPTTPTPATPEELQAKISEHEATIAAHVETINKLHDDVARQSTERQANADEFGRLRQMVQKLEGELAAAASKISAFVEKDVVPAVENAGEAVASGALDLSPGVDSSGNPAPTTPCWACAGVGKLLINKVLSKICTVCGGLGKL